MTIRSRLDKLERRLTPEPVQARCYLSEERRRRALESLVLVVSDAVKTGNLPPVSDGADVDPALVAELVGISEGMQ